MPPTVGPRLGGEVGLFVGARVGDRLGIREGSDDGCGVGYFVGNNDIVGRMLGMLEGCEVGNAVIVGGIELVGQDVGAADVVGVAVGLVHAGWQLFGHIEHTSRRCVATAASHENDAVRLSNIL